MVRLGVIAATLGLLLSQASAATSPWEAGNFLNRRQNNGIQNSKSLPTVTSAPQTSAPSKSTRSKSVSSTKGETGSPITTGAAGSAEPTGAVNTEWSNAGNSSAVASQTIDVDPRDPAGGVALRTPAIISGSQYYKIGDWVTFVWNYTSLSVTPTAVDVLATGSANAVTYTITANMTYEPTVSVLWDTSQFTDLSAPLLTQMYTLFVHDTDKAPDAVASPGYLATFNQYRFGMYLKESYVPLNQFKCVTCNSASALADMHAVKGLMLMGIITSLSFVWFFAGLF